MHFVDHYNDICTRVPTGLRIWGKVGNFILGLPDIEKFEKLPWWLIITMMGVLS